MTYYTMNPSPSTHRGPTSDEVQDTQPYPNDSASISSPSNKKQRLSSDRASHGISFNLVSLVTKFEALDALSLPFTTPSLKPAPLHISRNPSRQKSGAGSRYRRRLSTIFGPKRGSSERQDNGRPSEEELQVNLEDVFSSSNFPKPLSIDKKADAKKLRKAQTLDKSSSIRFRGTIWGQEDKSPGRGTGNVAAPYVKNERPEDKKGGSIGDKIRFYDGAVSTGNNTQAHPSASNTARPNTPVSISRTRLLDKSYFWTPSTGSSRRTCLRNPNAAASSPIRSNPASTARQQLDSGSKYSQTNDQCSPSRTSLSNATPQTMNSPRRYSGGRETSPSRLPVRDRRAPASTRDRRNAMVAEKQDVASLDVGGDGSAPPPQVHRDEGSRPMSRRRLSNKIGELYRVKSLEKKRKDSQGTVQPRAETMPSITETKIALGFERRVTVPRPTNAPSKVAAMRKIFDSKFSPRSSSPVSVGPVPCCALDPVASEAPIPITPAQLQEEEMVEPQDLEPRTAPTPPPLPPSKQRKASASRLPLRNSKVPGAPGTHDAFDTTKVEVSRRASPVKKQSPPKSKLIGDKVKLFENSPFVFPDVVQPRSKSFRRRLSKSLRHFFEAPSRKSQEDKSEIAKTDEASTKPKRALSPDGNGLVSSRGSIVGRWNNPPTAVSSGGDGTASERHTPMPVQEKTVAEIVVKSVECGLKQPRPVRAVEMKRMALLCKDRVGEIMDREKEKVSQRRKF